MKRRHEGKGAVVTGGAKGIGRGIVERLARDGAGVVIADVDVDEAHEVSDSLAGEGLSVRVVEADVRDEDALERAIETACAQFGRLDVMVNNAGIINVGPLVETEAEVWRRMLDINVVGIAMGSKAAVRRMTADGIGGSIVNASSGGGRQGTPGFSQYCATKAAVIMLSQSLAKEVAKDHIRVNCYTPGHIMTPLWENIVEGIGKQTGSSREETLSDFKATIPWGRFGVPEDVAAAVSWLCSEDAEFVSGQCLAMNGAELPW